MQWAIWSVRGNFRATQIADSGEDTAAACSHIYSKKEEHSTEQKYENLRFDMITATWRVGAKGDLVIEEIRTIKMKLSTLNWETKE